MKITRWQRLQIGLILLVATILAAASINPKQPETPKTPRTSDWDNFSPADYPLKVGLAQPPEITAEGAIVAEPVSGVILYEKNANKKLRPASTTKLMTALIALDYYGADDVLEVKRLVNNSDESEMGLKIGDRMTVKNLLYGLLVPSGNDAAYTLADNYPGGIEQFVYSMNQKAKDLHMNNTHFDNPGGADSNNLYTTARDLLSLAKAAIGNKLIADIVKTSWTDVANATKDKYYYLQNVNQLLASYPGILGVKTGYTIEAGECLVAAAKQNWQTIITVILKSDDRFGETRTLLDWALGNFQLTPLSRLD